MQSWLNDNPKPYVFNVAKICTTQSATEQKIIRVKMPCAPSGEFFQNPSSNGVLSPKFSITKSPKVPCSQTASKNCVNYLSIFFNELHNENSFPVSCPSFNQIAAVNDAKLSIRKPLPFFHFSITPLHPIGILFLLF